LDVKEEIQEHKLKYESTNTKNCGGAICSSEESAVMAPEQRDSVRWLYIISNS
jgi:hypothetical protein